VEMDYHSKLMKECSAETKSKDQTYLAAMQVRAHFLKIVYYTLKNSTLTKPETNGSEPT
jgi:hypothetical protein